MMQNFSGAEFEEYAVELEKSVLSPLGQERFQQAVLMQAFDAAFPDGGALDRLLELPTYADWAKETACISSPAQAKRTFAVSHDIGKGAAALVLDFTAPPSFLSRTPAAEHNRDRGFEPCGDFTEGGAAGACSRLAVFGETLELYDACARAAAVSASFRAALARGAAQATALDLDTLETRQFPAAARARASSSALSPLPPSPVELNDQVLKGEELQELLRKEAAKAAVREMMGMLCLELGGSAAGTADADAEAAGHVAPRKLFRGEADRKNKLKLKF
eukprot:tig00020960_g16574.t1